jgi:Flp pilus assembly protein TadD
VTARSEILPLLVVAALAAAGCASLEGARLYTSGTAALDGGEPARAVDDLERAAELLPEASEVHNHLGLAYQAADRPTDAENAFRHAVALDCDNAAAVENLKVAELRARLLGPEGER